ncbi:MAG: hypothetical protein PSV18_04065 [Methylobacter sp.]|nr:hypothetical protein [Candidatus Methylobacter titanis]
MGGRAVQIGHPADLSLATSLWLALMGGRALQIGYPADLSLATSLWLALMGGRAVQIGYPADLSPCGHILCVQILSRRNCDG